jgi:predicted PurR-regulated permease PerM
MPPDARSSYAKEPAIELTPRERRWLDAILVLGAIALGFVVLGFLSLVATFFSDLIFIFFLAWLLAFILSPFVSRLRTAIPVLSRAGAVFTVYFVLFGGLVVVTIFIASALVGGISDFIASVPTLRDNLPSAISPWQARLDSLGITRIDLLAQANTFLDNLSVYATQLAQPLQQVAVASVGALGTLLLVVVLSLYMVADRERLISFLFWLVPAGYKEEAKLLEETVSRSFGGFLRGQAITGIIFGAVVLLANLLFGLDYLAVTTAAAGLLMMVPFFGPFVAWMPPVLVALVSKPDAILGTFVVVGLGWVIILNFLQPRIMGSALKIHPIVVLASVLAGLKIAGVVGAIFGIPIGAVISAVVLYMLRRRSDSGPVAARAAQLVGQRQGRTVRTPREPDPTVDRDVEPGGAGEAAKPR